MLAERRKGVGGIGPVLMAFARRLVAADIGEPLGVANGEVRLAPAR